MLWLFNYFSLTQNFHQPCSPCHLLVVYNTGPEIINHDYWQIINHEQEIINHDHWQIINHEQEIINHDIGLLTMSHDAVIFN